MNSKDVHKKSKFLTCYFDSSNVISLVSLFANCKKLIDVNFGENFSTKEATNLIVKNKEVFQDYEIIKGNMDDVFLEATGYKLEAE